MLLTGKWYVWGKRKIHVEFWWGKLEGNRPLVRPMHRWDCNIKWVLKQLFRMVWTESFWRTSGTSCELFLTR